MVEDAEVDDLKASGNLERSCPHPIDPISRWNYVRKIARLVSACRRFRSVVKEGQRPLIAQQSDANAVSRWNDVRKIARLVSACRRFRSVVKEGQRPLIAQPSDANAIVVADAGLASSFNKASLFSKNGRPPLIGGRRVAYAIVVSTVIQLYFVVSTVILLSFVCLDLRDYIDRGGSKASSSGSLDFRDIYISILLFQAAYVWIKFRDVIPRGAVYHRRDSNKFEPRIKFPVTRGVGGKSKRIPLGLYDTSAEAEVAYRIAAFYCNKPKHRLGRLDLGGGAYFPIPDLSMDPNLPYEEKVKQVGVQVLKVYVEFEERRASRNLPPRVPGLALEMPTGEGQLLVPSPIQQLRQPFNSGMDSAMQGQGSQPAPNIHNGVDFNNSCYLLPVLAKTQYELLEAKKQNECLKSQLYHTGVENNKLKQRNSELECENGQLCHTGVENNKLKQRNSELECENGQLCHTGVENNKLKQRNSELECENGLLNQQIMQLQLQLQSLHQESDFDLDDIFS